MKGKGLSGPQLAQMFHEIAAFGFLKAGGARGAAHAIHGYTGPHPA